MVNIIWKNEENTILKTNSLLTDSYMIGVYFDFLWK